MKYQIWLANDRAEYLFKNSVHNKVTIVKVDGGFSKVELEMNSPEFCLMELFNLGITHGIKLITQKQII